jgi:hypothetical protein
MHALLLTALLAGAGTPSSTGGPASIAKAAESGPAPLDFDDARTQHRLIVAGGVAVGIVSAVAFSTGFDAERELQASVHSEADADALLNKRTVAGWVAWPTALISVGAISAGIALLASEGALP